MRKRIEKWINAEDADHLVQTMRERYLNVRERIERRVKAKDRDHFLDVSRSIRVAQMQLTRLRDFIEMRARFKSKTTRQVLNEIQVERQWIEQHAQNYRPSTIVEMRHDLDVREIGFYNALLPNALRQAAADATLADNNQRHVNLVRTAMGRISNKQTAALEQTRLIASDPARRAEFNTRYLAQLRRQLSNQVVQKCLDQPIGKELSRDSRNAEGQSIKNWPIVRESIWEVNEALLPLYPSTPRLSKSKYKGLRVKKAEYPQELLKDIVELFTTEFPDALKDLTVDDVKSRIQYQLTKLRKEMSDK